MVSIWHSWCGTSDPEEADLWEHCCVIVCWCIACGIVYGGVDCVWYCVWYIPLIVAFLMRLVRFDIVSGLQLVCIGSMVCDGVCCDSVGS